MEETFENKNKSSDQIEKQSDSAKENIDSKNHDSSDRADIIDSGNISKTSNPLPDDADIFDQLHYAAERLKAHSASREKVHNRFAKKINALWQFEKTTKPRVASVNHDVRTDLSDIDGEALVTLEGLENLLKLSSLAQALYEGLEDKKPELAFDSQILDVCVVGTKIFINPTLTLSEAAFLVVQALRRVYLRPDCKGEKTNSHTHSILYPLCYEPEDAVLLHRILEADCRAVAIWAAWEMKISGLVEVWNHVLASNERDMARAFEKKAKEDFRNITSGKAMRAAFDTFFGSAMMVKFDQRLIQEMLVDEKGLVFSGKHPSIIITPTLIDFIGELPDDKNYMIGTGERPLSDSEYAAVKDRSCANFLWFVKFERSFQETEREFAEKEERAREEAEQGMPIDDGEKIVALPQNINSENNNQEKAQDQVVKKGLDLGKSQNTDSGADNVLYLFATPSKQQQERNEPAELSEEGFSQFLNHFDDED